MSCRTAKRICKPISYYFQQQDIEQPLEYQIIEDENFTTSINDVDHLFDENVTPIKRKKATPRSTPKPSSVYQLYSWICKDRIKGHWCKLCKKAYEQGRLQKSNGGAWVTYPFQDNNKLKERATAHNDSDMHDRAVKVSIDLFHSS